MSAAAAHPGERPCGGGVTGRALALVADAIDPAAFPQTAIRFARFTQVGLRGQTSRSDLGARVDLAPGALAVASREAFDGALLAAAQRAGATLVRSRVADVAIDEGGVTITVTGGARHRAAYVIGADGANSLVRRRVATSFRRDQLSIATGYLAHRISSDEIGTELTGDPPAHIWSFPRPGHLPSR